MPAPATGPGPVLLAAVEGGGTTFVVSVAELSAAPPGENGGGGDDVVRLDAGTVLHVRHTLQVPSSGPSETLAAVCAFLAAHRPPGGYDAVGIATFGPVGVDPADRKNYGRILPGSPKREWRGADLLGPILEACSPEQGREQGGGGTPRAVCPHLVETDVNAPAYAEFVRRRSDTSGGGGGGRGDGGRPSLASLAYVTVGTGVGVGLVINGRPVHGLMHPEGGHVCVAPLPGDAFPGYSWGAERAPYGGRATVEGTASSVALAERRAWQRQQRRDDGAGEGGGAGGGGDGATAAADATATAADRDALADLPDDDPVWEHCAHALANLCATLVLLASVERIVLGGGVLRRAALFGRVRERTRGILNGYLDLPEVTTDAGLREYIGPSAWGDRAGLVGAFALARRARSDARKGDGGDVAGDDAVARGGGRGGEGDRAQFRAGFGWGAAAAAVSLGLAAWVGRRR